MEVFSFLEAVEQEGLELHSFMLLRNGYVVSEGWWSPYTRERRHLMNSLSKSFTSTAVGLAVDAGLLSVDDPVVKFFPDIVTGQTIENMHSMKIAHLLTMTTGHSEDTMMRLWQSEDGDWVRAFLETPIQHEPGEHFLYNSGATYMLSAIIQAVTGQTLLEYLQPRLLEPLGIDDATWQKCPRGIHLGGWGLSIRTEDIAKFGQLYLQKGMWDGRQLLSKDWIERAISPHARSNGGGIDWHQGYGYQFWRCSHDSYRGDGAFGQFCIVVPEFNAVVVTTASVMEMQCIMDLVWEHLLPNMMNQSLISQEEEERELAVKLQTLALSAPSLAISSPMVDVISGKCFVLEENAADVTAMSFLFEQDQFVITLGHDGERHQIHCGYGAWVTSEITMEGSYDTSNPLNVLPIPLQIAASGSWSKEDTLVVTVRYLQTSFYDTFTCYFEADRLYLTSNRNFPEMHAMLPNVQGYWRNTVDFQIT